MGLSALASHDPEAAPRPPWPGWRRPPRPSAAQAPRVLRIRMEKDISALDPAHAGTRSEHAVVWAISNRLTMFKPTGDSGTGSPTWPASSSRSTTPTSASLSAPGSSGRTASAR